MKIKIRAFCSHGIGNGSFTVSLPSPLSIRYRKTQAAWWQKNLQLTVPDGNKLPLEHFAAQFQMGLSNMLEANPGVDAYLPTTVLK